MDANRDLARQWVTKAQHDLLNADNNLSAARIPYDTVCFHCQQAAEKFLKAYLVERGETPLYTHDLLLLLERILPSNAPVEKLRDDLALLTPYAVEIRYPDDWVQPSAEDAREARAAAERVLKWLKTSRPELVQKKPVGTEVEENAAR
jgi:HEPN domain-containing protein